MQQVRSRADEDHLRSQREQEQALLFQRDMEVALQRLGIPSRVHPRGSRGLPHTTEECAHPPAPPAQDAASAIHEEEQEGGTRALTQAHCLNA